MNTVQLEIDSRGVARVTMNRPEVHNAFNRELMEELHQTFDRLGQDDSVRVVVLQGAGKNFSAGADINWMKTQVHATPEENAANARQLQGLLAAVDGCPRPVIARIQGAALGGGSGLICAADLAVCSPQSKFGFTEVRLGIIPAVISPYVMRRLGYTTARAYFLTGSRFDAQEASRIGMVHKVAEDLDAEVDRYIHELLQCAPGAQARIKKLVQQVWESPFSEQGPLTAKAIAGAWASPEGGQGLQAFLDKTTPSWVVQAPQNA